MKSILTAAGLILCMSPWVSADLVHTYNGTWEGTVIRETGSQLHLEQEDGSIISIPWEHIRDVEYTAREDAERILSETAALEASAAEALEREALGEALSLYTRIAEKAGAVRERAGPLYHEALELKETAEQKAGEIKEAIRTGGEEPEEPGPGQELRDRGFEFAAEDFLGAAGSGDTESVLLFLEAGMDVNERGPKGRTALMEACRRGRLETVKKLLEAGAAVGRKDEEGATALHEAVESEDTAIIQLIVDSTVHNG